MAKAKKKLTIKVYENRELSITDQGYPYYVFVTYNRKLNRIKSPTWTYFSILDRITPGEPFKIMLFDSKQSNNEIIYYNDERLISSIRTYYEDNPSEGVFDVSMLKSGNSDIEYLKTPLIFTLSLINIDFMAYIAKKYGSGNMIYVMNLIFRSKNLSDSLSLIKELNEKIYIDLKDNFPSHFLIIDFLNALMNMGIVIFYIDYIQKSEFILPIMEQIEALTIESRFRKD